MENIQQGTGGFETTYNDEENESETRKENTGTEELDVERDASFAIGYPEKHVFKSEVEKLALNHHPQQGEA
jgi:hypothetical protein